MTLAEFNGVFGFDHHPESCIISDRTLERFWFRITGDSEIENSIYPGSSIVNPTFRVAARVFGNTIYARKEWSKPLKLEVMCLFLLVHRGALSLGREFLEHVHRYKNMKGEIWFGGMITPLAIYFGLDLSSYTPLEPQMIDITYLRGGGVVLFGKTSLVHKVKGRRMPFDASKMSLLKRFN